MIRYLDFYISLNKITQTHTKLVVKHFEIKFCQQIIIEIKANQQQDNNKWKLNKPKKKQNNHIAYTIIEYLQKDRKVNKIKWKIFNAI